MSSDDLRESIARHVGIGQCSSANRSYEGCDSVREALHIQFRDGLEDSILAGKISLLNAVLTTTNRRTLERLLRANDIAFEKGSKTGHLRRILKRHIKSLQKGKKKSNDCHHNEQLHVRRNWPQIPSLELKQQLVQMFRDETSRDSLMTFTCASCAESVLLSQRKIESWHDLDLEVLRRPHSVCVEDMSSDCFDYDCLPSSFSSDSPLTDFFIDPAGVSYACDGEIRLSFCRECHRKIRKGKMPALSMANRTFLGEIPPVLKDLTIVEEAMIARCRAKCWVIQLKEESQDLQLSTTQRGMKGHVIIYPQRVEGIAAVLPPSVEDIITPICVVFVGSSPPSDAWLQQKAKPLTVRREKVRAALVWLQQHNRLYNDIQIDHSSLDSMEDEMLMPFHVDHVLPNDARDTLTSRYDANETVQPSEDEIHRAADNIAAHTDPIFDRVVITDVDGHASTNELRAAAVRHIKNKGGGYIQIPHDPEPVNEFLNPTLFPLIYPTLFPYGLGGFEDRLRSEPLSMKRHVKHLFNLADRCFQEHYSFLFTAFNILQRRKMLLHTSLKVKRESFPAIASNFAAISSSAVHCVTERVARGDTMTANNEDEKCVLRLMKEVQVITSHVSGSSQARLNMRNEICGLTYELGMPSFYITINPADVYNPLVKFLAGSDIDIDNLLPEQVPNFHEQSILIARNPAVGAKFFNIYMKAFIKTLLRFEGRQSGLHEGVLGTVNGYYGCVESQGRGTLHCHMLIWLEGGLNPNQIKDRVLRCEEQSFKDRLLRYLEDTISTCIPATDSDQQNSVPNSNSHPCSIRGINFRNTPEEHIQQMRKTDLHVLATKCQVHRHSNTCWKYWRGPPDPKECRFNLDEKNIQPISFIDPDTGEITLKCLDGLVNHFNATILEAVRCNMDIKFIGSGPTAKAVMYYITDYITKSQLKTHVALAAIEIAVKKLEEYNANDDDCTIRAKKLLQKCAHSMISHQELSAQQVCSYLMDFKDHFTSHQYRNIYWTNFESFVEQCNPSPECYMSSLSETATENEETHNFESDSDSDDSETTEDVDVEDTCHNNINEQSLHIEQVQNDEIKIGTDQFGNLVPKAAQVMDYLHRDRHFADICVWDFVAQIDKVRKSKSKQTNESIKLENECIDESDFDEAELDEIDLLNCEENRPLSIQQLLQSTSKKRPSGELQQGHYEYRTHFLRVRQPNNKFVPVPIGQSIPRRDRDSIYPKYCRLMLILFKPWQTISDLKHVNETWVDAFHSFKQTCSVHILHILDNMQILHECKDSRDDHFANRRHRHNLKGISSDIISHTHHDDNFFGDSTDEEILTHLDSIDSCYSIRQSATNDDLISCLHYMDSCRFFDAPPSSTMTSIQQQSNSNDVLSSEIDIDNTMQENEWRDYYEARRLKWKNALNKDDNRIDKPHQCEKLPLISTIESAHSTCTQKNGNYLPNIQQNTLASDPYCNVDSTQIAQEWTLNEEQSRAFHIIAEHSQLNHSDQLKMFLGGSAGTGKSRVINALKDFFTRRNQPHRFRLSSFMGVAARNISGTTLHASLLINQRHGVKTGSKTKRDLAAIWKNVDYLFIDEVSMISCDFLTKIHDALVDAKGNTAPFGGMNVIFTGDFAQLSPVSGKSLYAHLDITRCATTQTQKKIFGRLLWLSIKTVVLLKQIVRQHGPENSAFIHLLLRLREGRCTRDDFDLLQSRVIQNTSREPETDILNHNWTDAPIIVCDNESKDQLNIRMTKTFTQRSGRALHWYYCQDKHQGKLLCDEVLLEKLQRLNSGKTNMRLGKIPLVIGMPVMVVHNFDVEGGIVNGSTGELKQIRYTSDNEGRRFLRSCIVDVKHSSNETLPNLPPHHIPIIEDSVELRFTHPNSNKTCRITRTQVPILPGFVITAHKSQGQTLDKVTVDLGSKWCRGTEKPYVMISRATSLQNLFILRPFNYNKICCHPSQDVR